MWRLSVGGVVPACAGNAVGMFFQEPMTALNPIQTFGDQVPKDSGYMNVSKVPRRARGARGLARVRTTSRTASAVAVYPHSCPAGQRQRVGDRPWPNGYGPSRLIADRTHDLRWM